MRNLQIKLRNINHLQDFNSIVMTLFERTHFDNSDHIDFLNLRDLMKKLADKMYSYANRLARKISITIEINQYRSLMKLYQVSEVVLKEPALIYFRQLLIEIIEQGRVCFETRYHFEITNCKQLTK